MSDLKLSPEQMVFMLKNHELIEYARIEDVRGNPQMLDDFINSAEFQSLLGAMGWDDAIDRYEDMPEYDRTLRLQLRQQLIADVESGRVQVPTVKSGSRRKPSIPRVVNTQSQVDDNLPTLERLKNSSFTFDEEE